MGNILYGSVEYLRKLSLVSFLSCGHDLYRYSLSKTILLQLLLYLIRAPTTTSTTTTTTTSTRQPWTQPNVATTPLSFSEIDSLCAEGEDGYYAVPGTCRDYVFCLRKSALHFRCDSPWYWDQNRQECSTVVPVGC